MIEEFEASTAEELEWNVVVLATAEEDVCEAVTPNREVNLSIQSPEESAEAKRLRTEHQIAELSLEILTLGQRAKFCKKMRDTLTESLQQMRNADEDSDDDEDSVIEPTDEDDDDSEWVTSGGIKSEIDPAAKTSISQAGQGVVDPTDINAWRRVTIEDLGIKAAICNALRENPEKTIATLGDIADWTSAPSLKLLTDIPKIGESKATAIIAACDQYWAKNPQPEVQGALGNVAGAQVVAACEPNELGNVGQALQEAGVTPESVEPAKGD